MFRRQRLIAIVLVMLLSPGSLVSAQWNEGIVVRGHWVIDVKNADGTLASRSEFHNPLRPNGQRTIAKALSGGPSVAAWMIELYITGSDTLFPPTTSTRADTSVVLTGSIRPTDAESINQVFTHSCGVASCADAADFFSTGAGPISFAANQTIDVTVTFSFAAAAHAGGPQ